MTAQWAVLMVSSIIVFPQDEHARCHPQTIAIALGQLISYGGRIPPAFSTLVAGLRASMEALLHHTSDGALRLSHGDCWHQNAIQRADGSVALIDGTMSGPGCHCSTQGLAPDGAF